MESPLLGDDDKLENTEPGKREKIIPKTKRKPLAVDEKTLENIIVDVEYEVI